MGPARRVARGGFVRTVSVAIATVVVLAGLALAPLSASGAPLPAGQGYWIVDASGTTTAFGDARSVQSRTKPKAPVVTAVSTPTGRGYWLVTSTGQIFAAGDAPSMAANLSEFGKTLVVDAAPTPTGKGLWLAGANGKVATAGDASVIGSLTSSSSPVVSIAATSSGSGYWLLAASGIIHPFGDAVGYGSAAVPKLAPAIDLARTPTGLGYWILGVDGRVYAFGDAPDKGSLRAGSLAVGIAPAPKGDGYWVTSATGKVTNFGSAGVLGSLARTSAPVLAITSTPAASLSVSADAPSTVGANQTVNLAITVTNSSARPAYGVSLSIVLPTSGSFVSSAPPSMPNNGRLTVPVGDLPADSSYTVTIVWTAPPSASTLNLSMSSTSSNGPLATGSTVTVTVTGRTVASLSLTVGPGSAAGLPLTIEVRALDASGDVATDYSGTIRFSANPFDTGTLPDIYTFVPVDAGVHSFVVTPTRSGTFTVAISDAQTPTLTTSTTFDVSPGALASLIVTPTTVSVPVGVSQGFGAEGFDAYGNSTGDVTAATTFSIAPDGTCVSAACIATSSGVHTITVTTAGITATAVMTVEAGAASHFVFDPIDPVIAGSTVNIDVYAFDQFGNAATSFASTVSLTGTLGTTTGCGGGCSPTYTVDTFVNGHSVAHVTAYKAQIGATLTMSSGATSTTSSPFNVIPADVATLNVIPATATVLVGAPQSYGVTGADAYANSLTDLTSTAVLSIAPDGTCSGSSCTATAVGAHTVTATLGTVTGTADLTVLGTSAGTPPPNDPSTVTDFLASTQFLWDGPNAVQKGVADGAINPTTAAVIHGVVRGVDGLGLPGVAIKVVGHPEYGSTTSGADGRYAMALNGGGLYTIDFASPSYLPAHRQVDVPWVDYTAVAEVTLLQRDPQTTLVEMSGGTTAQIARGSQISDASGTRRATLLVPAGTTAGLVQPNGTTVPTGSLTLRFTEYTVGPSGPSAMPAPLPATSGYTFAVEISADEAGSGNGGREVSFNQPVYFYVDNYIGFPVGADVPAGYYDRDQAKWVASASGRVIKVLATSGGVASLDVNGDGNADTGTPLTALGITEAERTEIAGLYTPGATIWRTPLDHLSTWDLNWGTAPPPDATAPSAEAPSAPEAVSDPDTKCGSIIDCQNQVLGESIDVVGTDYSLNYRSDRVPGRFRTPITIPISGSTVPASLQSIELEIEVAGRVERTSYPPTPNQATTFFWDRKDLFGRTVNGLQPVRIRISYVYPQVYSTTSQFGYSTKGTSIDVTGIRARGPLTIAKEWTLTAGGGWTPEGVGLGSWTLDVHHAYDPKARVLHLGNGEDQPADAIVQGVVKQIVGPGQLGGGTPGQGVPADQALVSVSPRIALAQDGSIYLTNVRSDATQIQVVRPDNKLYAFAGTGIAGDAGDGGPATAATIRMFEPTMTVEAGGALTFVNQAIGLSPHLRTVDLTGTITSRAGTGAACPSNGCSLGGPITASLPGATAIAAAPDGSIIASSGKGLYALGPGDKTVNVAGNNGCFYVGPPGTPKCALDGGRAAEAGGFDANTRIAVAPNGAIYATGGNQIRRIDPDGTIHRVAGRIDSSGSGVPCVMTATTACGDGGIALLAGLSSPTALTLGADGSIYFVDQSRTRVRRITPDGMISTVLGDGSDNRNVGAPASAFGAVFDSLAVDPLGRILFTAANMYGIFRVEPPYPGVSSGDLTIASRDGSEVYVFNHAGRHLRTLHGLTGATIRSFSYDQSGLLASVTDFTGGIDNITIVDRDSTGKPLALVGPYGQRSSITTDVAKNLASVENPAGETFTITSDPDGLIRSFADPLSQVTRFTYDSGGRLTSESNATGGGYSLQRSGSASDETVTVSSSQGATTTYRTQRFTSGREQRTIRWPDGTTTIKTRAPEGTVTVASTDGTVYSTAFAPDPRFGFQAPYLSQQSVTTPAGLTDTITTAVTKAPTTAGAFGFTSLTIAASDNGRTTTSTYDRAQHAVTTTSPAGRISRLAIDDLGRTISISSPGTGTTAIEYEPRGGLSAITVSPETGSGSRRVEVFYNQRGLAERIVDPLGNQTTFAYDSANRPTQQVRPDGSLLQIGYDAAGNSNRVVPPTSSPYTFAFNSLNSLSAYTPPSVGTDGTFAYSYRDDGKLIAVGLPDGSILNVGYDTTGRRSSVGTLAGELTYAYSAVTGQLLREAAPSGSSLTYAYDGMLRTAETATSTASRDVSWTYNNNLQVTTVAAAGTPTAITYDSDGLVTAVGQLVVTRAPGSGFVSQTALGGVEDELNYDGFGSVAEYRASFGSTPIFKSTITRDVLGRVATNTETVAGITTTSTYGYDSIGRLTEVTTGGEHTSFTYDANGNRVATANGGGTTQATYDARDRLTSYGPVDFTYQPDGTLRTRTDETGQAVFTFDQLQQLQSVMDPAGRQIEYKYDSRGRRIEIKVDGAVDRELLYLDQLRPIAEFDGSGSVVSRFVYGPGAMAPTYIVKGQETYRVIADSQGSPRLVVNTATGLVAQRMDYDVFGRVVVDTNPGFQPFGFGGGVYDRHSGLVRFGVRDYDPMLGRWISPDPIRFASGDTNLYVYCSNDPVNCADHSGLGPDGPVCSVAKGPEGDVDVKRGTLAIGLTIGATIAAPLGVAANTQIGIAVDRNGNVKTYVAPGIGLAVGTPSASLGVSVSVSNAQTVDDLGGAFNTASVAFGMGPRASADAAWGPSDHGPVGAFGFTYGVGVGGSASVGTSNTYFGSVDNVPARSDNWHVGHNF